jgi:AAA+ superfamily predicted ATPase
MVVDRDEAASAATAEDVVAAPGGDCGEVSGAAPAGPPNGVVGAEAGVVALAGLDEGSLQVPEASGSVAVDGAAVLVERERVQALNSVRTSSPAVGAAVFKRGDRVVFVGRTHQRHAPLPRSTGVSLDKLDNLVKNSSASAFRPAAAPWLRHSSKSLARHGGARGPARGRPQDPFLTGRRAPAPAALRAPTFRESLPPAPTAPGGFSPLPLDASAGRDPRDTTGPTLPAHGRNNKPKGRRLPVTGNLLAGLEGGGDVGPRQGAVGRVVLTFEDDARRVGVRFDSKVGGGSNLGNVCEHTHGFFCRTDELMHDDGVAGGADYRPVPVFCDALFAHLKEARKNTTTPLIIFIRDADRAMAVADDSDPNTVIELEAALETLDERTALIGTSVPVDIRSFNSRPGMSQPAATAAAGAGSRLAADFGLDGQSASLIFGGGAGELDKGGPPPAVQHFLVRHAAPGDADDLRGFKSLRGGVPGGGGALESSLVDHLFRMQDKFAGMHEGGGKGPQSLISTFFPARFHVETPPLDSLLHVKWRDEVEADAKKLKFQVNVASFGKALKRLRLSCKGVSRVRVLSERLFGDKEIETSLSLAVSAQVMADDAAAKVSAAPPPGPGAAAVDEGKPAGMAGGNVGAAARQPVGPAAGDGAAKAAPPVTADAAASEETSLMALSHTALAKGIALAQAVAQRESSSAQQAKPWTSAALKNVATDNEFERKLLSEGVVVPAAEVGVRFDDIGALDSVKEVLQEVVMLPLRRPGLFRKGNLAVPTKGVLLFGLPGTGKTLSAKAVATEAGANFINITMSSIASKWFGEGEKYVRAVFTLARKLSPAVIFVDEVDSMLGRRERPGEHEAMRKIKNEFMLQWDGLRSSDADRVLVLGSTNRPFDLDDAVLRRFPRRLMVDLPDTASRARILRKITEREDLAADVDLDSFAETLDGYSGSDLRNLCVSAAMEPVREILAREKAAGDGEVSLNAKDPDEEEEEVRALRMADFAKGLLLRTACVSPRWGGDGCGAARVSTY